MALALGRRRARGVAVRGPRSAEPAGRRRDRGRDRAGGLRVVRGAGRGPGAPRADDRRGGAAGRGRHALGRGALRAAARLRADGGADARLAAGDDVRRDRAALGDAVAQHADARHRARSTRASACSRRPTCPRGAGRRGRSRSSARRSSTGTPGRRRSPRRRSPGVRLRPLAFRPTFHKFAGQAVRRRAAARHRRGGVPSLPHRASR